MAGRILVLDDEENYAEMLQELLKEHNYRVDMATRPERAIDLLEEIPYDLVISDYKMPVMDGADFLKRSRELYPNLPFILVSGLMNTPELVKVANMSVTLVMEKPLNTAYFLEQVERFSEPMSDDEKSSSEEDAEETDTEHLHLPDEPRFISAKSLTSVKFTKDLWSLAQKKDHCFIWEPNGGEAELALKDLSAWLGNEDKPLLTYQFSSLADGGVIKIQELSEDLENSHVVLLRLNNASDIPAAKEFACLVAEEASDLFLAFVLSSTEMPTDFLIASDRHGLVLPALNLRPSDVGHYALRFLRIATERLNESKAMELSQDAIYALLAKNWSSCREIQDVMTALVNESSGSVLTGEHVARHLPSVGVVDPAKQLGSLLTHSQAEYLRTEYAMSGLSAEDFAHLYDLDGSIQSLDDLMAMPLVDANMAKF
ncbi:MAG TPA: hypothetical protein DCX06_02370 [Opitutae bacterium]|nr:hypothetical protein [Opitutae bacterium]